MKRSITSLFILLLSFVFLNSCKKDPAKIVDLTGKIKTVSLYNYSAGSIDVQELFYNEDGSIAKYTYSAPGLPLQSTTIFQYLPRKVRINTLDQSSTLLNWEEDFLNSNGSIDSLIQGGTGAATGGMKVIYDALGQPVEIRNYSFVYPGTIPIIQYNSFANGNLVRSYFSDQQIVSTAVYSTHIDNVSGSAGTSKFIHNTNLVTALFNIPSIGATPQLYASLNYTFDYNGKVLTETTHYQNSNGIPTGQVISRAFTYY